MACLEAQIQDLKMLVATLTSIGYYGKEFAASWASNSWGRCRESNSMALKENEAAIWVTKDRIVVWGVLRAHPCNLLEIHLRMQLYCNLCLREDVYLCFSLENWAESRLCSVPCLTLSLKWDESCCSLLLVTFIMRWSFKSVRVCMVCIMLLWKKLYCV